MYGLVNKALEEMIIEQNGTDTWARICAAAGHEQETFVATMPYPDASTHELVAAAAEELAVPAHDVLRAFGRHWILNTGAKHYEHLMKLGGATMREFLHALPDFHDRVTLIMPALVPPEFECRDLGPDSMELHYRSTRMGLGPFVEGLVEGLGQRFGVSVEHSTRELPAAAGTHLVLTIRWY